VYFYSTLYALASRVAYAQMPRGSLRDELDNLVESVFSNDMKIQETIARDQLDAHRRARRKGEGGRLRRLYRWVTRALGLAPASDSASAASQSVAGMSVTGMSVGNLAWEIDRDSELAPVGRHGSSGSYAFLSSPHHGGGAVAREGSGGSGRGGQFDDLSITGTPNAGARGGGSPMVDSMRGSPMTVSAASPLPPTQICLADRLLSSELRHLFDIWLGWTCL